MPGSFFFYPGLKLQGFFQVTVHKVFYRVFDPFLNSHEETNGFPSVDYSVVIGKGHIHYRCHDDLPFLDNRAFNNVVHAKDPTLGRVYDGGRQH